MGRLKSYGSPKYESKSDKTNSEGGSTHLGKRSDLSDLNVVDDHATVRASREGAWLLSNLRGERLLR